MTPGGPVNLVRPDFPMVKTGTSLGWPAWICHKEKDRLDPRFEPDTFAVHREKCYSGQS